MLKKISSGVTIVFLVFFFTFNFSYISYIYASDIHVDFNTKQLNRSEQKLVEEGYAYLTILNKITAKSDLVKFKVGETKYIGNLSIKLCKCIIYDEKYRISNLVLLEIFSHSIDKDPTKLFYGWISSASPSMNTIEHPVYEIFSTKMN